MNSLLIRETSSNLFFLSSAVMGSHGMKKNASRKRPIDGVEELTTAVNVQ